jgi:hypothetical protein
MFVVATTLLLSLWFEPMILSTLSSSSSLSSTASSPSCGSLYELRPGLVLPTAHVKFPVRRGISSGHDELDRPSHLLLFFPFIGYLLNHQLIRLRHHFPFYVLYSLVMPLPLFTSRRRRGRFFGQSMWPTGGRRLLWWSSGLSAWTLLIHLV